LAAAEAVDPASRFRQDRRVGRRRARARRGDGRGQEPDVGVARKPRPASAALIVLASVLLTATVTWYLVGHERPEGVSATDQSLINAVTARGAQRAARSLPPPTVVRSVGAK